ncbi:class II 3-deoxy-7-phosphoheptulonate synthase [Haliangium ochraceum]|uniref:Phospho-2-dehydro-3-deoxyheptonate aldolase n=1 Tax=Haliangium ochraceum (strain DSM 14365 / JCM 11303 / SMP-2) TaxID=502025 RepID=D0LHN9_HALO1|nr:3-deoxy-7-phosphoheptulonate synthase class II [Haliangium ochraceum]ACY12901.1 phospho-2-dehydro-3-deoxyheptonate aldolase [Haliangium ochraceum DSM 14365]
MKPNSTPSAAAWSPTSWQEKTATQQATYPDQEALDRVVAQIARLPPLVTSWEIEALKEKLGRAARGEAFLLQGGDCAESFDNCDSQTIAGKLKVLLQMSLVLTHGIRRPIIRVGRIAGQYAKPRSADTESRGEVTLPSYRGDLVNRLAFTDEDRTPNPDLMLRGYERAALTLNFIRALADGGFADLHHPEYWDLSFAQHHDTEGHYERIVASIRDAIAFMESVGEMRLTGLGRVDFYTSHEGLMLHYEQAQTRRVPRRDGWYNLSTHMPWIGMRTATMDSAHIEYFRGIRNPVAVKLGPAVTPEWITQLLDVLHPDDEPGRLTFIHRLGAEKVSDLLPRMIDTVQRSGKTVLWTVDPMHGNTESTERGVKTRHFDKILAEVEASFEIHESMGSTLGGVHLELTGDNVTECVGGARGLSEADLERAYRSTVDPRLNAEQALELALRVTQHLHTSNQSSRR